MPQAWPEGSHAADLLRRLLSPEQLQQFETLAGFTVRGASGQTYFIAMGNLFLLPSTPGDAYHESWCVLPGGYGNSDMYERMVAQYLHLVTDDRWLSSVARRGGCGAGLRGCPCAACAAYFGHLRSMGFGST